MPGVAKFRVSSYLKDIIGKDLVTNEFVAIFELVKNSFDAGASRIDIEFDVESDKIIISDDGSGMNESDIRDKWLFVAYSDKSLINPDTYRDKIKSTRQLAGSKGIGRFACDTLGERLTLYTSRANETVIHKLDVNWQNFEKNSSNEFQSINVNLSTVNKFPNLLNSRDLDSHGTILIINNLRQKWDEKSIFSLRRDLAKTYRSFWDYGRRISIYLVYKGP